MFLVSKHTADFVTAAYTSNSCDYCVKMMPRFSVLHEVIQTRFCTPSIFWPKSAMAAAAAFGKMWGQWLLLCLVSLVAPVYSSEMVVACVGDSITAGVGASCPPCPSPHASPLQPCPRPLGCANSWPAQLQQQLGSTYQVQNYGHVAATMQSTTNCDGANCSGRMCDGKPCRSDGPPYWATSEFKAATNQSQQLHAVVIMLGTNDAKHNNWHNLGNSSQFRKDAAAMVDLFLQLPGKPRIFLSTPPPLYSAHVYSMNQTVVAVDIPKILQDVADSKDSPGTGDRVTCVDMISPLGGWPGLNKPELFLPNASNHGCNTVGQCKGDGCHPDDAGHRAIASVLFDYIFG